MLRVNKRRKHYIHWFGFTFSFSSSSPNASLLGSENWSENDSCLAEISGSGHVIDHINIMRSLVFLVSHLIAAERRAGKDIYMQNSYFSLIDRSACVCTLAQHMAEMVRCISTPQCNQENAQSVQTDSGRAAEREERGE